MADYALDMSGDKVVLRCQVDDCEWIVEPEADAASSATRLWDPDLMQIWAQHLHEVHQERSRELPG